MRYYNLVAVSEKTGKETLLTSYPATHKEAVAMKNKFTSHPGRRIELREVVKKNPNVNAEKIMLTEKQKKMVDMWNESGHVAHYYPKKNKISLDGFPAQSVASAMRRIYLHLETVHKNPAPKFKAAQQATGELKRQLDAAMKLYHNFSGHEPELVGKTKKPKIPDVGIVIGELDGVAYETVRDGKTEKYFHQFDKRVRPLLVSSFDGSQVYILGGEYDFTADGIVDATDKKFSPRQRSK